jgi:hypothetical protein
VKQLLIASLLCLAASIGAAGQVLEIPFGSAPMVDGIFGSSEWSDGAVVGFSVQAIDVRVHLIHDAGQLYIAFEYVENPEREIVVPEIYIDPDDGKTTFWAQDDWWFHVSAQDCEAQGERDDFRRCGITRPRWAACPNFAPEPYSVALDAIEIRIPLSMVSLAPERAFGLGLSVRVWPADVTGYWPQSARAETPATWADARLMRAPGARIAFDSDRNGNFDIFVMDTDGSSQTAITTTAGDDDAPAWCPDRSCIAYSGAGMGGADLFVIDSDGGERGTLVRTTGVDGQPDWSPDGTRLVFVSLADGDAEICTIGADGREFRQLTHNAAGDFEPRWLSDGRIGFSSDASGFAHICVMNSDGTLLHQITQGGANDAYPDWSPDGSRIAFCSDRDGNWEIYTMNGDGGDIRRLTYTDVGNNGSPRWSPDGTEIAFESTRDGDSEIYVMDADGGRVRQLTDNDAEDRRPCWEPSA